MTAYTFVLNSSNLQVINLASGGATIDAALVTPFEPTVLYASVSASILERG